MNPSQAEAIRRAYLPIMQRYHLPAPTVPAVPIVLSDECRCRTIVEEIQTSQAEVLILLGDKPIEWFLVHFDNHWHRLSDFAPDQESYGRLHCVQIGDKAMKVLPLAHPRQIARLGHSSFKWTEYHNAWINQQAGSILSNPRSCRT
jgi:hypothetical protein